jgi:hypothetical protein
MGEELEIIAKAAVNQPRDAHEEGSGRAEGRAPCRRDRLTPDAAERVDKIIE